MAQKIVVIGAGVIGASAAYHLAQAGCDVTVVDAGMGRATDASFGWINASFFADDAHFALRAAGIAAYQNMSQQIDIPVQTPGSLVWEDEGDAFDTQLARLHAVGATVSELDRAAFQKLEPHVAHAPDRIFHFADECVADSGALADGVLAAACGYGAQVISGAQVVEIVEVDVFDVFDGGVDVAGQGEVDEEAGSIGAALHGVAKGRHVKDRARCGGGADNDIEMLQLAGEVCKING